MTMPVMACATVTGNDFMIKQGHTVVLMMQVQVGKEMKEVSCLIILPAHLRKRNS